MPYVTRAQEMYADDVSTDPNLPQELPKRSVMVVVHHHEGGHVLWDINIGSMNPIVRTHEFAGNKHVMQFDYTGDLERSYMNGALTGVWAAGIRVYNAGG